MPTPKKKAASIDLAQQHNDQVLREREQRIKDQQEAAETTVDLGLKVEKPPVTNATEFVADAFDRANFGDPYPTYTRILYGPDPLFLTCPGLKEKIEAVGLEEYAECTAKAILDKQELAFDDPLLRKGIKQGIRQFGVKAIAKAFADRILRIPTRSVQVEADRGDDDEVFGRPLEDAVRRYGNPGMAPKFLSERCIGALGMRGYRVVMNEHGDPVKVGTLIMGEIPIEVAERRRLKAASRSDDAVREQEESFQAEAARFLKKAGAAGNFARPLQAGDVLTANASEKHDPVTMGITIEREAA